MFTLFSCLLRDLFAVWLLREVKKGSRSSKWIFWRVWEIYMTFCFLVLWAEGCATLLQAIAQVITTRSASCLRKMLVAINVKANAKNTFYNNRNVTSWSFLSSLQPNECLVLWHVELIFNLYRFASDDVHISPFHLSTAPLRR